MIDAIAHSLIHSLWQGLAIAILLALALRVLRSSQSRYAAGCLALLSMLGAAVSTFLRFYQTSFAGPESHRVASHNVTAYGLPAALGPSADGFLPWLTAAWFLGVVLLSARWILSWAWLQLRVRTSNSRLAPQVQSTVAALRARLGVSRQVLLRSADWLSSPAVSGWLRPTLLIPASALTGLTPDQLTALLAHELAHIRRHDYLMNLAQTAIETLLFYHPAAWWISGRIRAERENCCDDVAVSVCGDRITYASALVALEEKRPLFAALTPAATGGSLKHRVRRILYGEETPAAGWPAATLVMLVLALAVWNTPKIAAQSSQPQPRHEVWLNETAVYIISAQERAAFVALTTDAERDRFIEQFWQRRNPRPDGTAHNDFKDEHYRRIAYANERFAAPPVSGWKTDRGRIYIVFGPPDEIESHPAEHREQWLYRHIEGVGDRVIIDFVDGHQTIDPNPSGGRYIGPANH